MTRIDKYQKYHGAVLSIITEHPSFTSINKLPDYANVRAVYLLNHDTVLYIKHSTLTGNEWSFTFSPRNQHEVRRLFDQYSDRTFIILVCSDLVCLLRYGEYAACLDENFSEDEWLVAWRPEGGGFRVRGKMGELSGVIPLNRFPDELFENG